MMARPHTTKLTAIAASVTLDLGISTAEAPTPTELEEHETSPVGQYETVLDVLRDMDAKISGVTKSVATLK